MTSQSATRDRRVLYVEGERRLVLWETKPPPAVPVAGVVVVAAGFCRRMYSQSHLAHYLAANGLVVIRYDALDHLGLSDGDIIDYSMSAGLTSLVAAIDAAADAYPDKPLGLVASSISGRLAMRAARVSTRVTYCVLISAVVNLQATLVSVFGENYAAMRIDELPEYVVFEGNKIGPFFIRDGHTGGWFDIDGTRADLQSASCPVMFCYGEHDEWVGREDMLAALEAAQKATFVELAGTGHDVTRNPGTGRTFITRLVEWCRQLAGADPASVVEPDFADLLRLALEERREQRLAEGYAEPQEGVMA